MIGTPTSAVASLDEAFELPLMVSGWGRRAVGAGEDEVVVVVAGAEQPPRRLSVKGTVSLATATYNAGARLAGRTVEVRCQAGLVQLRHGGVLVATHARRDPLSTSRPPVSSGAPTGSTRPAAPGCGHRLGSTPRWTHRQRLPLGRIYRAGAKFRRRR